MELFLYYLLRASILMALFYGLYKAFFANNTFYKANRLLLICMLLMTSLLPLFRFSLISWKEVEPGKETFFIDFSSVPVTELLETQSRLDIPWMQILMILFAVGFLFTFIRYLIGLSQIGAIIRKSEKQIEADHTVLCVTDKRVSPFSWVKYIVLSPKELLSDNQAVIRHERAHIQLGHSLDMILFDIFTCIFWFNPFSWLLRREIQSVHEYQADEQVLRQGIDSRQYQLLLIRKSVGDYKFALANNFHQRDLHKRITMMKKNKTDRRLKWNYAMVLPALVIAMIVLSVPKLNATIPEEKSVGVVEKETTTPLQTRDSVIVGVENAYMNTNPLELGRAKIVPKDSLKTISRSNFLVRGADIGKEPLLFVDEKRVTSDELQQLSPHDIQSISVLKEKSATEIYGDEGKDGVILVETKKNKKNDDVVSVGAGSMDSLRGDVMGIVMEVGNHSPVVRDGSILKIRSGSMMQGLDSPLVVIDGEKMDKDFDLGSIDPNEIQSISILKGKSATDTYGDEGRDGVVIITKKKL